MFQHGHLRLYLLRLLDEQPRHGYELIRALSDRFDGSYAPSAGTIYPRLAKLEAEGLVTKTPHGRKTIYAITDRGRQELRARAHEFEHIDEGIEASLRTIAEQLRDGVQSASEQLRREFSGGRRSDVPADGPRPQTSPSAPDTPSHPTSTAGTRRDRPKPPIAEAHERVMQSAHLLTRELHEAAREERLSPAIVSMLNDELSALETKVLTALGRRPTQ